MGLGLEMAKSAATRHRLASRQDLVHCLIRGSHAGPCRLPGPTAFGTEGGATDPCLRGHDYGYMAKDYGGCRHSRDPHVSYAAPAAARDVGYEKFIWVQ